VPRVWAGLWACLVAALLVFAPSSPGIRFPAASAASSSLTKRCAARVAAARFGVTLVASRISVTATVYNATTVQTRSVRPALRCSRARIVLDEFLVAKLTRPLNQCTDRVLRGGACKVGSWLCYENAAAPPPKPPAGSYDEICTHILVNRHGVVRRLTHVFFRETDQDHA
jgi:hypothetical protein